MGKEWNFQLLLVCFAVVIGVAAFGGIFTSSGVKSDWYDSIKPSITPPDFIFSIVWTILFILIAFSLYFTFNNASTARQKKTIAFIYGANLLFNALWSVFYFGLQNARIAFIDIILLIISCIWMINISWRLDRKAGYMLIPYLLWLIFAGILNWSSI